MEKLADGGSTPIVQGGPWKSQRGTCHTPSVRIASVQRFKANAGHRGCRRFGAMFRTVSMVRIAVLTDVAAHHFKELRVRCTPSVKRPAPPRRSAVRMSIAGHSLHRSRSSRPAARNHDIRASSRRRAAAHPEDSRHRRRPMTVSLSRSRKSSPLRNGPPPTDHRRPIPASPLHNVCPNGADISA